METSHLAFLNLSFLNCKMQIIIPAVKNLYKPDNIQKASGMKEGPSGHQVAVAAAIRISW